MLHWILSKLGIIPNEGCQWFHCGGPAKASRTGHDGTTVRLCAGHASAGDRLGHHRGVAAA